MVWHMIYSDSREFKKMNYMQGQSCQHDTARVTITAYGISIALFDIDALVRDTV
jgi:hypothetical protein